MRIRIDCKLPQQCSLILKVIRHVTGKKIPQQAQITQKKNFFISMLLFVEHES